MQIAIIDYGMGNLHSVLKSVWTAGQLAGKNTEIFLSGDPERVSRADKVIFPGQGAMPDCIAALTRGGLDEAVKDALKNKPFSESASARNFYSTTVKKETPTAWAGSAAKSDALSATSATGRDAV